MPFQTFDFERADLRARLAALSLEVKLLRFAHARRRARWDVKDSDHDTEGPDDDDGPFHHDGPTQLAQNFPPRDHNGPPGGPLPEEILPLEKPPSSQKVTGALRDATPLFQEFGAASVLLAAPWIASYAPLVIANADAPKDWEDLKSNVGMGRLGYDDHHLAEEAAARRAGFPEELIQGNDNLVSIPRMKHWAINGYMSRVDPELNDMSPREFLKDKSWEERQAFGLSVLKLFGVLKP
jgi:hypothetical protein